MDEMVIKPAEGAREFKSFVEFEAAFDAEVRRVDVGFVRIGYYLRVAKDTNILQDSGYANMEEFAWKKYKIDKSQASRFININIRFSEGGYSDKLIDQFTGYGVAKLGELLTLPDEIIEELPPELTRSEIQEVKKEFREEQKISELEVMMEEKPVPEEEMTILEQWMDMYMRDNPERFLQIKQIYLSEDKVQTALDILAPAGAAAEMARIQGAGRLMLSVRGKDQNLTLTNIRSNAKTSHTWDECVIAMKKVCPYTVDPKEVYRSQYGIPFPGDEEKKEEPPKEFINPPVPQQAQEEPEQKLQAEAPKKPEVAPVQPEKKVEEKPEIPETKATEAEADEITPDGIQAESEDYPEVVPENTIVCHDGTEVVRPAPNIRDEGLRLLEEIGQWLRTGTKEYIPQVNADMERLGQILEEIIEKEYS